MYKNLRWKLLAIAVVLEPALLLSLAALCLARRWANGQHLNVQWIVALVVPALMTGAVAWGIVELDHQEEAASNRWLWIVTRAVAAAVIAAAMYEYFRLRARAYAPSFSEARLQALQARIRPHFLFNSLNTVLGLIRTHTGSGPTAGAIIIATPEGGMSALMRLQVAARDDAGRVAPGGERRARAGVIFVAIRGDHETVGRVAAPRHD